MTDLGKVEIPIFPSDRWNPVSSAQNSFYVNSYNTRDGQRSRRRDPEGNGDERFSPWGPGLPCSCDDGTMGGTRKSDTLWFTGLGKNVLEQFGVRKQMIVDPAGRMC